MIEAAESIIVQMQGELDSIQVSIDEADDQMVIQGNQDLINATAEANRLRQEKYTLESEKDKLIQEAVEMRQKGIEFED